MSEKYCYLNTSEGKFYIRYSKLQDIKLYNEREDRFKQETENHLKEYEVYFVQCIM